MTLLREWVTATRSLLNGEFVTVSGQYVRLSGVALDWPPATVPPLLVGARGPKTLALAGELADGLVLDAGISPEGVRQAVDRAAARRPHYVVNVLCAAGAGSAERIEAELATSSQPLSSRAAVGSPQDVAETVRSFGLAGATTVVLQPTAEDPDVAATIELAAAARTMLRTTAPWPDCATEPGPGSTGCADPESDHCLLSHISTRVTCKSAVVAA
jgi:alkanesulfonate monooxygenase SsuD/methylene tetrahydromethanopterin reductase-like flavin-dependent oxidoreductase (luciferase family)